MQRLTLLALFVALLSFRPAYGADGFEYKFQFSGTPDTAVYLAYHYGDRQYIVDTAMLANGTVTFSADTVLPSGMYMLVFPSRDNEYFEFIVDEPKFKVTGDVNDLVGSLEFKGSKENDVFYEDLRFLQKKKDEADPISSKMKDLAPGSEEYSNHMAQLRALDAEVKQFRKTKFEKYPDLLYIKMVKALTEVDIPEPPVQDDGSIDSFYQFRYIRQHAFDNLDWNDDRLLRTPAVYNVIYRYLNNYTYRIPDSIIVSTDRVLAEAKANPEVFKYCLIWMLNEYANSKIMGMDAVYVHLATTYYETGEAFWLDEAAKFRITDRAKRMKPTLIGKTAPNIKLKDINGRTRALYDVESKYTILYFWDPDCSHCREETPVLKRVFDEIKNLYDIKIYAVNTQLEIDKWLKFIDKHNLDGWFHMADFDNQSNYRSFYDISATPVLLLLDQDKKIIAKRIVSDQLKDFMQVYEQQQRRGSNR